jgi:sugar-specific transcriptional regulator TrmB
MVVRDSVKVLADLGFTNLEAEIYAFLLQESPATGYRIAQAIGKPAANTYKAIQTLEQKGAVIVEDGASRMCRAVSSEELLSRLTREFESKRSSAQSTLSALNHTTVDERIYQIRSREQVFQRAREMLAEANQVAVGVLPGKFADQLAENLLAATSRGVDVALKSDQSIRIEGVDVVVEPTGVRARTTLHLVTDGDQTLIATFDDAGGLLHAVWTRSPMLAVAHHEGLASELCLSVVAERIEEGAGQKRLTRALGALRSSASTAGYAKLKS